MLPKKSIEEVLHVTPCISDRMADAVQLWSDMYEGHSPWLKEPSFEDPTRIVSLGLPAMIASEKARMVTLEMKTEISAPMKEENSKTVDPTAPPKEPEPVGSTERAEFLEKQYKKLKRQLRRQLEYGIAKGGLVIKPYIVQYKKSEGEGGENRLRYDKNLDEYEIEFDFVQADRFFPLSFDSNGKVLEAAFIQNKVDKANQKVYTRLEYHKLSGRTLTVQNMAFESTDMSLANSNNIRSASNLGNSIKLTDVPEWSSLEPVTVIEDVDRLLFAYFRMPEANTVDPYSPLGVSGFSRAIQLIKDADMQYSRIQWEFEAGEMAIDVDRDALKFTTENGYNEAHSMLPQKQQRLFRKVDLNAEDTYEVFAPSLRDASLINGLNMILMRIEDVCSLSRGTFADVNSVEAKTATELKIQKQRSYATNTDIQMALQDALDDVVYVMDVYCTLYNVTPDGDYEVSYEWDDSILVDSESELSKRLTLMQNGLASKLETRMWYYGETENQAKLALTRVNQETEEQMRQNMKIQQEMAPDNPDGKSMSGQNLKSAGTTTSAKQSTGQQADSLENPMKKPSSASMTIK